MKTKEQNLLASAQSVALSAESWADLSNTLFDPVDGLVAKAFPTREGRDAFVRSNEYKAIRKLIDVAQDRTGLVEGATPKKSGKFVVRLPRSLHAALDCEADEEGVSLNQLVVTKLAVQMSRLAASTQPEMAQVAQAYLEVREGYSIDRVVADPALNRQFLRRCRELGLSGTDFDLNWKLFNGRKNKFFSDLPKTKNYTPSKRDEFEFSSEIAIRYVQEQFHSQKGREISLDKIICDPDLATEFDEIATKLAPGFSPLDYRCVALGVRKAAGRYSSKAQSVKLPDFDILGPANSVRASTIPLDQGMYLFRCEDNSIFIGETDNLRNRIERHFEFGGKSGIPDWLYKCRSKTVSLGIVPTPDAAPTERKILELGAVYRFKPLFNYIGGRVA
ncbi:MAG TPA: toxin-antitoxin system HicB family antitoxin [Pirellulales bacterium]|jgi:site-specific DNA-methyltransferase (adenine-specific)|nr:toxin-antitoxin system HicB family antitoxin [Pirellulales bacterium]